MKKLTNLIPLNHKVSIFIPSTVDVNKKNVNEQKKQVDFFLSKFSEMFGGATSQKAIGCWKDSENGKLVKENVIVVFSCCDEKALEENIDTVVEMAEKLREDMGQQAISLDVDNVLYFV